jgi:hypothetical protein
MNKANVIPINPADPATHPLMQGVNLDSHSIRDNLDDPNNISLTSDLTEQTMEKVGLHNRTSEVIKLTPLEDGEQEKVRQDLGEALLRHTLNPDQAYEFAHGGKAEFETAISEQKHADSLKTGSWTDRRQSKKAENKALDAEHIGLIDGARAVGKAQTEVVEVARKNTQANMLTEDLRRAA